MPTQDKHQLHSKIKQNLAEIKEMIDRAARVSGRSSRDVSVLAISKRQPIELIEVAYQCGQLAFGESYVQEALEKMGNFKDLEDIRWDMVGHVQSRKARQVAENFHAVHSLDSLKLAKLLNQFRPASLPPLEVFLEVNIGDENSKTGFPASSVEDWQALIPIVEQILELKKLRLVGLMAMPPLALDPQASRPYFEQLRQLKDFLNEKVNKAELTELSAGTSADFEIAIEEGATVVRIGERLFGPRPYTD